MHEISKILVFLSLLVLFVLILLIIKEAHLGELFLEYRKASNGKTYGIQEIFKDSHIALDVITKLHNNMITFTNKLNNKYPDDKRVNRLIKGFKNVEIEETTENQDDDNTSFTINKGELLSLCVRKGVKDEPARPLHDYNSLCFVIIHELAHIASVSEGHNYEFIENFKFLLKEAVIMGFYKPIDYSKNPFLYCGKIKVSNNPYY